MAYDGKLMRLAQVRYEQEKQRRQDALAARERSVYAQLPRVREIDAQLRGTMGSIISSAMRRGTDPRPAIAALREENLRLQNERAALLTAAGYPADYLEDKPVCARCGDTGYVDGAVCACLRSVYARVQLEQLSRMLDLGTQSFETFRFDLYSATETYGRRRSARANMEYVFDACRDYAYQFSERSGNLLLSGDPGLGKTFLSACIARVVSERGYSVVYDTAAHVFERFEAQKFTREDDAAEDTGRMLRCDLLIVDDLGTELTTEFVRSTLYQIVNTRLITGKKTIINTNLAPDTLSERYGAATLSRIRGSYQVLPFYGADLRRRL